jgi:hypothetical protein
VEVISCVIFKRRDGLVKFELNSMPVKSCLRSSISIRTILYTGTFYTPLCNQYKSKLIFIMFTET